MYCVCYIKSYMILYMENLLDQHVGKQERAYATIRNRILNGLYNPGYRLVIDALARELGASQIPIREAIRRLEAEGLVHYQRHSGATVAGVNQQAVIEGLTVLALLEGYATALAGPRLRSQDLTLLRQENQRMREALAQANPLQVSECNRQFHFHIYTRCPNEYLVEQIRQAWTRLDAVRRTVFLYIPQRGARSAVEHDELIRLIESGAPAAEVEEAARRHKLATAEAFRTAADPPM